MGLRVVGVDASARMLALLAGAWLEVPLQRGPPNRRSKESSTRRSARSNAITSTPKELRLTIAAWPARTARGWLIFDLDTDRMMNFTISNPIVAGESAENHFVISSTVNPGTRTCDTKVEVTRAETVTRSSEQHRQYFHTLRMFAPLC